MYWFLIGIAVNICGSLLCNLGTNYMKNGHNLSKRSRKYNQQNTERPTVAMCSTDYWRLGLIMFIIGSIINFCSFAFAAQSLLACLGSVQFISNVFFARIILKERPSVHTYIATGVIVIGIIITVIFSNHKSETYTSKELISLYDDTYLTFLVCVGVVLTIAELSYCYYTSRLESSQSLPFTNIIRPCSYSLVSATIGTQSILQSKCLAEIIKNNVIDNKNMDDNETQQDQSTFVDLYVYFVCVIFLIGISFWLYRLNNALKLFPGLIIIPLLQVFWTTSAIIQGGIYFKEFEGISRGRLTGFIVGMCVIFLGVFLLTSSIPQDHKTRRRNPSSARKSNDTGAITNSVDEYKHVVVDDAKLNLSSVDDDDDDFQDDVEDTALETSFETTDSVENPVHSSSDSNIEMVETKTLLKQ